MLPWSRHEKSPKFRAHRPLLITGESPLSHPPGYLVNSPVNHPEGHLAGYSPSHTARNPKSDSAGYPSSYWTSYPPENPVSSGEDCQDSNSADPSAGCPDNRPERNPGSNRENNGADNLPDNSESNSADSLPDCPASYLPSLRRRPNRGRTAVARLKPPPGVCARLDLHQGPGILQPNEDCVSSAIDGGSKQGKCPSFFPLFFLSDWRLSKTSPKPP